ncbi:MAG: archease [Anaerolineales bacterium]|nr:archease [Anaerolineales bacterium]
MNLQGYEERAHTADWALRVWAPDLESLFAESARGMNALSGVQLADDPRVERTFDAAGPDSESLLVAFLSELIYFAEQEWLAFDTFDVRLAKGRLEVKMAGAPLTALSKAIKAVTYHLLHIRESANGCEVEIVFDV